MSASTHSHPSPVPAKSELQFAFLALLPRIRLHACIYFRHIKCPHRKEDCVQEAIALAYMWFCRLAAKGRDASAFVSTLATLAARAVKSGRRICGQERARDVMSALAQQRHGFKVESMPASTCNSHHALYGQPHGQQMQDEYEERLADNTTTPVPDQVQFRIDFAEWLQTLTSRERRLIREMARNERTKDLARRFDLSPGRISQIRRELHDDWAAFCDDLPQEVAS